MNSTTLLVEIARCPLVQQCLESDDPSPCGEIVRHQWPDIPPEHRKRRWRAEHQMPEPWVGDLANAPLLFLSSNPSLSQVRAPGGDTPAASVVPHPRADELLRDHPAVARGMHAPKACWSDKEIIDRYLASFHVWMDEGIRPLAPAGEARQRPVPFWRSVRRHAEQVFGRDVRPGKDYALTEIVHCKSKGERGVAKATEECVHRYLRPVLAQSPARVVIVLGRHARNSVRSAFSYPDDRVVSEPLEIVGRERRLVLLSHPAARGRDPKYPRSLASADIAILRSTIKVA